MKKLALCLLLCFSAFAKAQSDFINVSMYLDTSYSMENRNMAVEMEFLEDFFEKHPSAKVDFVAFSNDIVQEERFVVEKGDWSKLAQELVLSINDGATSYALLDFNKKTDFYILLTDGDILQNDFPKTANAPVIILNSQKGDNELEMRLLAAETGGSYNLLKLRDTSSTENAPKVMGKVTTSESGGLVSLAGAKVTVEGSTTSVVANELGGFVIDAEPGDYVEVSHVGRKSKRVRVSAGKPLDIFLENDGEALDEVVLVTKAEQEDQAINVGNRKIQEKRIGYSVERITDNEISALDVDVKQAVKGQFANLEIANNSVQKRVDLSQFLGRGKNMSINLDQTGLIVLDGVPVGKSDSGSLSGFTANSIHINPDNIVDITYLKGLAATNQYGTLGRNGVILITTKSAAVKGTKDLSTTQKIGTTDFYNAETVAMNELPDMNYIYELKIAENVGQAYDIYLKQRKLYGDTAAFFLDAATYFKGWGNPLIVTRILSNVEESFLQDKSALKALAYKYQETSNHYMASKIYERLITSFPEDAQSYRDLAACYADLGATDVANTFYQKITTGSLAEKVGVSELKKAISKEYRNFIRKNKAQLNMPSVPVFFHKAPEVLERRIVVEWNDPTASFDLQIVNPENRFFTWEHSPAKASQRMSLEKLNGYNMEEFFLTSGDKGQWKFNIVNYGFSENDKGQPIFLKFTIYDGFGSANERKMIKVVRLDELDTPMEVLRVSI